MYEVTVRGWFAAAHQLRLPDGSLEPLHGHNWQVAVTFAGAALDGRDTLVDFTLVQPRLHALLARLHDRNLSELAPFRRVNASAERVAQYVAARMSGRLPAGVRLVRVEVEEAPGCAASYLPARGARRAARRGAGRG